ncbi:short-chain dehydrogenase/reductase SDR [Vibrio nigripulchritudo ATCC 27043]|uniref:SDR family oxidoreductase n=1 Tax=Vibrio nigripulchritudo TaxID=28173 RepID=UPI00021C3108|nr:SDR family oxidoreductase [Vibrio nigripulchritudo]EGU60304.1 short-chain dehydrogenase/reductase SDR [Vibrio nigripulchritudo ATCC 27043]BDU39670.1 short-chain dehydrogenase [Vibrio nigripulchritudo]BDU45392.1 short-chain dehydrogenase [Vibrio nigripulchritudo]
MKHIFREKLFDGRVALVTGGGSGIGLEIARLIGQLGAKVVIAARDIDRLNNTANQLRDEGIDSHAAEVNIRDAESVADLFRQLEEKSISVDILINNAGGQFTSPAIDISSNGFKSVLDLNLQGTFHMCQAFAKHSKPSIRDLSIVNIVLCLEQGIPGMAHAAAARAGVVNLTKTLAWEWADKGIRVNAIAPGTIDTEALKQYDFDNLQSGINQLPLKRIGQPSEIAQAVAFLVSPAASYITGICLAQDGGEHLTGASPQI